MSKKKKAHTRPTEQGTQSRQEIQVDLRHLQQVAAQLPVAPNGELIKPIEGIRDAKLLTLVLESPLDEKCIGHLYEQLKDIGETTRIDLFLESRGGKTEVPWRIVSLIREFCEHFAVLVPFRAHSAATHIAIGADEVVMTPRAELSPVDPSRRHPLLPGQRDPKTGGEGPPIPVSVQDLKHCVVFVAEELQQMRGTNADSGALSDIICALFDRVHPLAIGAIEQSYRLGRLITRKVLETHLDKERDKDKIDHIEQLLSDEYRSHSYPICRREVRDDLGLNVTFAAPDLQEAMENLLQYYFQMFRADYDVKVDVPILPIKNVGFLDTATQRRVRRAAIEPQPTGVGRIVADWWVKPPEQEPGQRGGVSQ